MAQILTSIAWQWRVSKVSFLVRMFFVFSGLTPVTFPTSIISPFSPCWLFRSRRMSCDDFRWTRKAGERSRRTLSPLLVWSILTVLLRFLWMPLVATGSTISATTFSSHTASWMMLSASFVFVGLQLPLEDELIAVLRWLERFSGHLMKFWKMFVAPLSLIRFLKMLFFDLLFTDSTSLDSLWSLSACFSCDDAGALSEFFLRSEDKCSSMELKCWFISPEFIFPFQMTVWLIQLLHRKRSLLGIVYFWRWKHGEREFGIKEKHFFGPAMNCWVKLNSAEKFDSMNVNDNKACRWIAFSDPCTTRFCGSFREKLPSRDMFPSKTHGSRLRVSFFSRIYERRQGIARKLFGFERNKSDSKQTNIWNEINVKVHSLLGSVSSSQSSSQICLKTVGVKGLKGFSCWMGRNCFYNPLFIRVAAGAFQ